MAKPKYIYQKKSWRVCPTKPGPNSFFHAAFGTAETGQYFDKHAKVKRLHWLSFLTFYKNENQNFPPDIQCMMRYILLNYNGFEDYINHVKSLGQPGLEDLRILSTVENIKIVIISAVKPIIYTPITYFQNSYPYSTGRKNEVVICKEQNNFHRLVPDTTESKRKDLLPAKVSKRYVKQGDGGLGGMGFQLDITTVVLLNTFEKNLNGWQLKAEDEKEGVLNDIVLKWKDNSILIQCKHKQNPRKKENLVTAGKLIGLTDSDFSLPKYFKSYLETKAQYHVTNVIICTNTKIESNDYLNEKEGSPENILQLTSANCQGYTFKDNILTKLKDAVNKYFVNKAVVYTDDDVKEFVKKLIFVSEYPSGKKLEDNIEELLKRTKYSECSDGVSYLEMYGKVKDWFKRKHDIPLGCIGVKAMFFDIWRDKYVRNIESYKIIFKNNIDTTPRILHITSERQNLLHEIQLYQSLREDKSNKIIILGPNNNEMEQEVIEAFGLPIYTHLIIIWPKVEHEETINKISVKLKKIMNEREYKKVVLVGNDNLKLIRQIKNENDVMTADNVRIILGDFTDASQEELLNKKSICFQGNEENRISLTELLTPQEARDYAEKLMWETLVDFIKGEVKVGSPAPDFEKDICCYKSRNLRRKVTRNSFVLIKEENIYDVEENVIVIADIAGTGKSTTLKKVAKHIKEKEGDKLWVIVMELKYYTGIFDSLLSAQRKNVDVFEILNLKYKFNELEKLVVKSSKKLVIMLDGVDEIASDSKYKKYILDVIHQCLASTNIYKVFIFCRLHIAEELEEQIGVTHFTFESFTETSQIEFLNDYWMHKFKIDENDVDGIKKCRIYAETLIYKLTSWVSSTGHNEFAGVPQQLRMLADIFIDSSIHGETVKWEGCKNFLKSDDKQPKLPSEINISQLYDMFVEMKRRIFLYKLNPVRIAETDLILNKEFDRYRDCHINLAVSAVLSEKECRYLVGYWDTKVGIESIDSTLLDIGIVQIHEKDPIFIHETFAEYFLAEYLLRELQKPYQTAEFKAFFLNEILCNYRFSVVRMFLNSILDTITDSLPKNIIDNCQTSTFEDDTHENLIINLVHRLAADGHVSILKLLFKCIDFKEIRDSVFLLKDWTPVLKHLKNNTITILQTLMRIAGVNIVDVSGRTPLHYAVERGYSKMTEYLVGLGATVNYTDLKIESPLHLAVCNGHLHIVKFLVNNEANIMLKNILGFTTIDYAVEYEQATILKYLLEQMHK